MLEQDAASTAIKMNADIPIEIECHAVRARLNDNDFLLVDCRETDEHQTVHIEAARLIPMSELAARSASWSRFATRKSPSTAITAAGV